MMYEFRSGSGFSGNAEETYKELESIRVQNDGRLEPNTIVEQAEAKDSPLHPHFEWDNKVAGGKWRIWQARALVRAVIQVDDVKSNNVFIHISNDSGQYYQNINVATVHEFEIAVETLQKRAESLITNAAKIEQYAETPKQKRYAKKVKKITEEFVNGIRA